MPQTDHTLLRSVLYVPASNERAMTKSMSLGADAVVFDLEDAVAPAAKAQAREALVKHFAIGPTFAARTVVRVNAIDTSDLDADLQTVARVRPNALLLPKVGSADDLRELAARATAAGVPDSVGVWAMVETAAGILALDAIVRAGLALPRGLQCLVVGTNDIAKETGIFAGDQRAYLMPWLMGMVLVAKRHGVVILDGVWNDFRDQEGFEAEARQAMKMGFDGKTLIHPTQIAPANRILSPSPEALEEARRIVAIFSDPAHARSNVVNMEGRMVERLHLEQALRLLQAHASVSATGQA